MPYIEVLQKYAVFEGRASRREYWLYFLISLIIAGVMFLIHEVAGWVYILVTAVPHGLSEFDDCMTAT